MNAPPLTILPPRLRGGMAARRVMLTRWIVALVALGSAGSVIPLATGCSSPRRGGARRLLESIAKSNRRLAIALNQFGDIIASRLEEKASKEDVLEGLASLQATFAPLRKGVDEWLVPKSPEAEALVSTYRAYLDKREAIVEEFAPQIVEIVTTQAIPFLERPKRVQEIVGAMNRADATAIAGLKAAQRSYAASAGVFSYE